ncbi:hypothetical protein ACQ4PT_009791 [Festuca glaucescens]
MDEGVSATGARARRRTAAARRKLRSATRRRPCGGGSACPALHGSGVEEAAVGDEEAPSWRRHGSPRGGGAEASWRRRGSPRGGGVGAFPAAVRGPSRRPCGGPTVVGVGMAGVSGWAVQGSAGGGRPRENQSTEEGVQQEERVMLMSSQEPKVGAMTAAPMGTEDWSKWSSLPGDVRDLNTEADTSPSGGAYPQRISGPALVAAFGEFENYLSSPHGDSLKVFSDLPEEDANNIRFRFFVVGLDAQLFLHIEIQGRTPFVFKMNTEIGKIEPVESVGRFAILIGHHGCLAVDADKFPGIEANCIYYTEHLGSSAHIWKYNIKDNKVERLSEVAEFMKHDKQFVLVAGRPFTIIQLLCSYTINCRDSELVWQQTL